MAGILASNLEEIGKKDARLKVKLGSCEGSPVALDKARSGALTFRYLEKNFHSAYDPEKESKVQADEILSKKPGPDSVILFGLGCGYLLKELIARGMDKVIVYEPSTDILRSVLSSIDLSKELSLSGVFVSDDMRACIGRVREADPFENILCYSTTPYKQAFPEELKDLMNRVSNAHITNKVGLKTDIDSRLSWLDNYFENLKHLPDSPPIDVLKGRFKGKPMVIVGAGPSLKKNAHLLKDIKGKALIVAAITAYKPLLKYGVIPDFVIASEKVDLPEYFTNGPEDRKTRLILAEVSHPGMFSREVKEKFVFFNPYISLSLEQSRHWGSDYFPEIGGSVTTAALDMGVMFGCSPIVFIGQDLCFGGDATHAPGGVYIAQNVRIDREKGEVVIEEDYVTLPEKVTSRFALQWLKGLDGKPVPSKFDWATFHQWFENYMVCLKKLKLPVEVINATEGGAYIEGMEHALLSDVIEKYIKEDIEIDETIEDSVRTRPKADIAALAGSFASMHKGLKETWTAADAIIKEIGDMRKSLSRSGFTGELQKHANRIKKLEDVLFSEAQNSPFIWEALTAHTYGLKEYLKDGEAQGDAQERFRKDMEVTFEAYKKITMMCKKFYPVTGAAVKALEGLEKAAKKERAAGQARPEITL